MALAEATVRVTLDVAHFERELRRKVTQAANHAGRDFDKEMTDQLRTTGRNSSTAFRDAARTGMSRAGRDAARDFDLTFQQGLSQTGGKVAQRLGQGLQTQVGRAGVEAGRRFSTNLTNTLDGAGAQAANSLLNAITGRLAAGSGRVGAGLARGLQPAAVNAAGSAGRAAGRQFNLSFGVGTTAVGRPLIALFAVVGSAIIEAIRPALSIVATLPGLLFTVASAALITATATKGIGDAFKAINSGDIDKITEAMAKLSPAAQAFVREFAAVRPQLRALRTEIQDAFFAQISGQVEKLSAAFTGPLRRGIVNVSNAVGNLANQFLDVFSSARGVTDLRSVFRGTSDFVNQLAPGLRNLTQGLLDFSASTAPGINSLGRAFSGLLTRAGEFLTRAADSGQALVWVEGGITGVRELARSIGDVVEAFGVLLAAARPLAFGLAQIADFATDIVALFGNLPGPLQTAAIAAVLFTRSGLPDLFNQMNRAGAPLTRTIAQMGQAYSAAAGRVQQFNVGASVLGRSLNVVRGGFGRAADAALGFSSALRNGVLRTASAIDTVLTRSVTGTKNAFVGAVREIGNTGQAMQRALITTAGLTRNAFVRAAREIGNAGQTMQRVLTGTVTAANSAGVALRTGFVRATEQVASTATAAGRAVQSGFIAATTGVAAASNAASRALQSGLIRASIETEAALTRVSRVIGDARDTLRGGLVPTALAIDRNFTRATVAVANFGETLRSGVIRAANATATSMSNLGTSVQVGFARSIQAAENAAVGLASTIRSGLTSATNSATSALRNFGASMSTGVLRPLFDAGVAYRAASTQVRDFAAAHVALNTPLGQSAGLAGRVRDAFNNLNAVVAGSGAAVRSLASGPLRAAADGLRNLGSVAAGAGAALTTGISRAAGGLINALGGPWGLAIAGAGIALSLLAGRQDEARRAAAEHASAISQVADTLNRQSGAITNATVALKSKEFAEKGLIKTASSLGISAQDFVNASLGQASALARVTEKLRANATETVRGSRFYRDYGERLQGVGVSLSDLTDVSIGNADATARVSRAILDNAGALGLTTNDLKNYFSGLQTATGANKTLADAIGLSNGDLSKARDIIAQQVAAMTPAQRAAQTYADALGVLADNASDADAKARALNEALNVLAGGTVSAEVAQGRFTELLKTMDERLADSVKGLKGINQELVTNAGRINTASQGGAFLVDTYEQLSSSLSTSAAATLQAGRATGDLDGALVKIAQQTQNARDQFIQTAKAMGLPIDQANRLADTYGLIPAKVLTTVTDAGTAQATQLQILGVYSQLKNLPPNTPVRVQGLTEDAIRQLRDVGVKVEAIPDSKDVKVTATTKDAVNSLQGLINRFSGTVINFVAGLFGGKAMGDIVPNAQGNVLRFGRGGKHLRNMPANRAEIVGPNTWRVIGDRARNDEAYIPINSSARSRALLLETARRMGFTLLGDGGVLGGKQRTGGSGVNVAAGAIVINAPFADPRLVARATVNELAKQVGAGG